MTVDKLTKSTVEGLEARSSDYVVWCGQLPGFGCRVRPVRRKLDGSEPGGPSKSFVVQYRVGGRNSPTRKVTIGPFGKLTVEQARKEAERILAKAKLGEDIAGEKAKRRTAMTMNQLCDEYLEDGCDHKKASTIATDVGRIERHIKPLLGNKIITDITRADVERFMRDIAKGRTKADIKTGKFGRAIVTGGQGTATRTVRLLGGIFSYAVAHGYIETNPRLGVKVYADGKGERFLSGDELRRLGDTLRKAETEGLPWQFREGARAKHRPAKAENQRELISPHAVAAIRLLLLTGCRAGEILNLKWEHVDFERGFLNLSDSKTGKKQVVLGAPALKVLVDLPRIIGNPYVIVGEADGKPRSDLKRPWSRIAIHAGFSKVDDNGNLKPDLRLHDLRHSYASVGAASGMGLGVVGKLLGHASPSTTARYSHFADDPLRRASESIAGTIAAALAGDGAGGNVVSISKG